MPTRPIEGTLALRQALRHSGKVADEGGRQLEEVLTLLRGVTKSPENGVAVLDAEATIQFTSQQLDLMVGYPTADLVQTDFRALLWDDLVSVRGTLPAAATDFEHVRLRHVSGVAVAAELSLAPLSGLGVPSWLATLRVAPADTKPERQLPDEVLVEQYCHSLSTDLAAASSVTAVAARLQRACGEIGELTNAHTVSLVLDRPQRESVENLAHWIHPDYARVGQPVDVPRSAGSQWRAAVLAREFVVDDATLPPFSDHSALNRIRDLGAFITMPFSTGDQRGALVLTRRSGSHAWQSFDSQLARTASPIIAAALHGRRLEQLWQLTYELGPIGISVRTVDGQLVECNQNYIKFFGLAAATVNNTDPITRVHPEDLDERNAALAMLDDPDRLEVSYELRAEQADGSYRRLPITTTKLFVPGQADQLRLTMVERPVAN